MKGTQTQPTDVSTDELAEMVSDATVREIWEAFGKAIQDKAGAATHDYVAMPLSFPSIGEPTLDQIQPGYAMSSDNKEYLDDLYSERFDAHIILRGSRDGAVVPTTRKRVVQALENAE